MSGGHFEYKQYQIDEIIDELRRTVKRDCLRYPEGVLTKFKEGLKVLEQAAVYAHRIDWLLSGDDGDESFLESLEEDLSKL